MRGHPESGPPGRSETRAQSKHPGSDALRALFERSTVGMAMLDTNGRIVHANSALAALVGVGEGDLKGRALAELCTTDDALPIVVPTSEGTPSDAWLGTAEVRIARPDGSETWAAIALSPAGGQGGVAYTAVLQDVSERKVAEARLVHQAYHDPLTTLANRELFRERVEHALTRSSRDAERLAVLILDLDNFKTVNDTLGHGMGDRLLQVAARRLQTATRGCDTVARLGGDEFGILLEDVDVRIGAQTVAERIIAAFRQPIPLDSGRVTTTSGSIGIAVYSGSEDTEELLRNADVAMYEAKAKRPGQWVVFDPAMHRALIDRVTLEADLRRALQRCQMLQRPRLADTSVFPAFESREERSELSVAYQPIVDLSTGRISGVEALARWMHPTHGAVSPDAFIPVAEGSGLIRELGRWVLREACEQGARWNATRPESPVTITVNLSARQLELDSLAGEVASVLEETKLDPRQLILEITETVIMQHAEAMLARLHELKGLGVGLAIDDFGTGYSSLAYLQRFPVDVVKIDRVFTEEVRADGEGTALVRTILALAELLSLKTIAEGVEEPMQRDVLRALGCDRAQGYLFGRPLTPEQMGHALGADDVSRAQTDAKQASPSPL